MRGLLSILALVTLLVSVIVLATVHPAQHETPPTDGVHTNAAPPPPPPLADESVMSPVTDAICILQPTEGHMARGVVRFHQTDDGVEVDATIKNLASGSVHAIHVHQFGDLSAPDGTSAGSHYNPEGYDHGLPGSDQPRHAGDMGNVTVDDDGVAKLSAVFHNFSVDGPHDPVLGRAVVLHEQPDDGGQPTGHAGARIAIGIIGVAPPYVRTPTPTEDNAPDAMPEPETPEDMSGHRAPPAPRD